MRATLCLALGAILLPAGSGCGDDDRAGTDAGPPGSDAAGRDAGPAGGGDAGPRRDGGAADAGPAGRDAGRGDAIVGLTFAGCAPDFGGDVVVVRNAESIAVTATRAGSVGGSVQLALQDERGALPLSTRHRVDTGAVVNLIVGTTWTNIAQDSAGVLSGEVADPIGGTLRVATYDEAAGRVDVTFEAVTLQNVADRGVCTVDGRLQTLRLSF